MKGGKDQGCRAEIASIVPLDDLERLHIADALAWVDSGAPLYRTAKPATPPKHLVAYFAHDRGVHWCYLAINTFCIELLVPAHRSRP